jgi:hypothetical protein
VNKKNARTITATVDALIASEAVTPVKTVAPTTAPVKTVAPVKATRGIESIAVDGFEMTFATGASIDVATLRAMILRETENPWFPVITVMASPKISAGVLTITRTGDAKTIKAPLARIKSAITRAENIRRDAMLRGAAVPENVKNISKVAATGHATEKGVWRIVRMP